MTSLPEPVRRWLRHCVEPGTPPGGTLMRMHGRLRLGRWWPFRARQVVTPRGFVWAATVWMGPVPVIGFDRYRDGVGEMHWRLAGLVPVQGGSTPDITRSAAGRLATEMLLTPAGALSPAVRWRALDETRAVATVAVDDFSHDVEVTVDDRGRLTSLMMQRWGDPLGEPFGWYPFGGYLEGEQSLGGMTVARSIRAGWFAGTPRWGEGEFFRAVLDDVVRRDGQD